MSTPSESRARRALWAVGALALAFVGLVAFGLFVRWNSFQVPSAPTPDPVAALQANTQGVAHMEQFDFRTAEKDFDKAVLLAPDWLAAHINLGIALLNSSVDPTTLEKAESVFRQVLARDPENPYAHYCLGVITEYRTGTAEAYDHFDVVCRVDPLDPQAWSQKGVTHPAGGDSAEAQACFEEALRLDPYLNNARYNVAVQSRQISAARRKELLDELDALRRGEWETRTGFRYLEMGRYAEAVSRRRDLEAKDVGPLPVFAEAEPFRVRLADGAAWAKGADLGGGPEGELRRAVRGRFGATLVLLDYDRDGRPDLFLLGAVVQDGKVRDLLLHNEGGGGFEDVTAAAGLAEPRPGLGCAVGDFDNDGLPDLLVTGVGRQFLFRNAGGGKFEDVSAKAGLDKVAGVCLAAAWADLDQDGDLDLLLGRYADSPEQALANLRDSDSKGGGLMAFLNRGEATSLPPPQKQPPLSIAFRPLDGSQALLVSGAVAGLAVSDVDGDRDVDVLVLADGVGPMAVLNDRLLRFHRDRPLGDQAARWNGTLVLDVRHEERSDVLLLPAGGAPVLCPGGKRQTVNSPPLLHAQAVDLDLDGWTDVVGLSAGKAVLLHNEAGVLTQLPDAFGGDGGLLAVAAADLDDDGAPDVLLWSEADGLKLRRNLGNGNQGVRLDLSGQRDRMQMRTNEDAIGAWVAVQAGTLWTGGENATVNAGLGQSRLPLVLGVGRHPWADAVRVRWPDGLRQAELLVPAGRTFPLVEFNRRRDW